MNKTEINFEAMSQQQQLDYLNAYIASQPEPVIYHPATCYADELGGE